jgi:hypothetical protein
MGLSQAQAISLYGTEAYTGWGEVEAAADAKAKNITAPTSADQVLSYLDSYQNNSYQQITVPDLKIPTAEELKASLTPSTPAPTPISRTGLLEEQRLALGVGDLETELNTLKTEERTIQADLRATTGAEEGKPVALGVMSGRITEEQRQAQTKLDYLNVRKATVVDELNVKYNAINTYINYAGLDYQDAVNAYQNDFNQNVQVQNLLSGFRQEAWKYATDAISLNETMKQNSIDNARANLTTVTNAITSGNMSYGDLSADEKLNIQKLEIQSGLPVGTISKLQISAKDKILGFSSDNTQAMVMDGTGGFKVINTGLTKTSSTTETATQKATKLKQMAAQDASSGVTLRDLLRIYNPEGVSNDDIYSIYNQNTIYGAAKESPEELAKLGIKTISNSSPTSGL